MDGRVKIDFNKIDGEDIHTLKNVGSDTSYIWFEDGHSTKFPENIFVPLCEEDFTDFLMKNKESQYIVRGLTLVSPNGLYMSIIRNNDFSENDEEKYISTYSSFLKDIDSYFKKEESYYTKTTFDFGEIEMDKAYSLKRKSMREDYGYGTIYEYLKGQNYEQKFEDCNVRLIIKKNR